MAEGDHASALGQIRRDDPPGMPAAADSLCARRVEMRNVAVANAAANRESRCAVERRRCGPGEQELTAAL
jgi:hypothetical protein